MNAILKKGELQYEKKIKHTKKEKKRSIKDTSVVNNLRLKTL